MTAETATNRAGRLMRWAALAGMAVLAAAGLTPAAPSAPSTPSVPSGLVSGTIPFRHDLSDAMRQAKAAKIPTIVYFSSPSCQWCRKMQVTSFADRTVKGLAGRFMWVKVDTANQPDVAALFRVQGLPHLTVLDSQGQQLTSKQGYMPPDVLARFLRKSLILAGKDAAGGGRDLAAELKKVFAAAKPAGVPQVLRTVVEQLAEPDPAPRKGLMTSIRNLGPKAWPALCELMKDKRLGVRAAAGAVLAHATKHDLPFDAFAALTTRRKQIAAWREWIRRRNAKGPTSRPAPAKAAGAAARKEPK